MHLCACICQLYIGCSLVMLSTIHWIVYCFILSESSKHNPQAGPAQPDVQTSFIGKERSLLC